MVGRILVSRIYVFSQKLNLGVLLLVHKRFPNRTLFKNIFPGNTILSIPPSYARSINSRSTLCHHIIAYVLIRYNKNIEMSTSLITYQIVIKACAYLQGSKILQGKSFFVVNVWFLCYKLMDLTWLYCHFKLTTMIRNQETLDAAYGWNWNHLQIEVTRFCCSCCYSTVWWCKLFLLILLKICGFRWLLCFS